MSESYTESKANTFTITNARYLASKIETDLMRLHRYYGRPTLSEIKNYHQELVLLQTFDFLDRIEYGFVLGKNWVKALSYTARQGGILTANDDPGGISYTDIKSARFTSVLTYNNRWNSALSDKQDFLRQTPVLRETVGGYLGDWTQERAYSSGGCGLLREGI